MRAIGSAHHWDLIRRRAAHWTIETGTGRNRTTGRTLSWPISVLLNVEYEEHFDGAEWRSMWKWRFFGMKSVRLLKLYRQLTIVLRCQIKSYIKQRYHRSMLLSDLIYSRWNFHTKFLKCFFQARDIIASTIVWKTKPYSIIEFVCRFSL
jgi:hypothetical protein